MPAKSLTWIHLSDLHFGHGKGAQLRFEQKMVTDCILRDAQQLAEELGPPDAIFVTGDIAFSASADTEYPAVGKWLGKLLAALRIGSDRVLTVPGNHDVDRRKVLEGPGRLAHLALRARPGEINELLEKAGEMECIWPKLAAYQEFASAYGSPKITPARPFWRRQLASALGSVEVLGLNTALLSFDGGDSPENLALGLGQLQRAFEELDRQSLLFVLQHHPPRWLRDGAHLRALLQDWPHLLLCGHVHEQDGFVTLPFASRGNVDLVAGAGHQDASEAGEHAYAWGRLHPDGLDYFPRAWVQREGKFLAQRIEPPNEQKGYSVKLGQFAKYPRAKLPERLAVWLKNRANHPSAPPASDLLNGLDALEPTVSEPAANPTSNSSVVSALLTSPERHHMTDPLLERAPHRAPKKESGAMNPVILRCLGLSKHYSSGFKLPTIDLMVHHGQIVGVVGHNGVGKTTLLRMIARDLSPTTGAVAIGTVDADGRPLMNQVTFVPQSPPRYGGTLLEHLRQQAAFFGYDEVHDEPSSNVSTKSNADAVQHAVALLDLKSQLGKSWNELSGGYKVRAAIAVALVAKPGLLVLDEPLAPLDPLAQNKLLSALWAMARDTRIAIVMSSQHVMELEHVADEMILLLDGQGQPYKPMNRAAGKVFEIVLERTELESTDQRKAWEDELNRNLVTLKSEKALLSAHYVQGRILIELASPRRISDVSSFLASRIPMLIRDITGSALAVMYGVRRSMGEEKHERTDA